MQVFRDTQRPVPDPSQSGPGAALDPHNKEYMDAKPDHQQLELQQDMATGDAHTLLPQHEPPGNSKLYPFEIMLYWDNLGYTHLTTQIQVWCLMAQPYPRLQRCSICSGPAAPAPDPWPPLDAPP